MTLFLQLRKTKNCSEQNRIKKAARLSSNQDEFEYLTNAKVSLEVSAC